MACKCGKPAMWKGNARSTVTWNGKKERRNAKCTALSVLFPSELNIVFLVCLVLRLMSKVMALTIELKWQKEQLNRYARQKYVNTTQQCEGQLFMEDVATWLSSFAEDARTFLEEQEKRYTVTYTRKPRKKRGQNLANMLIGTFPLEVVDYYPDDKVCPECNGDLEEIGVQDVRRTLVIIPAHLVIREERVHSKACKYCDTHSTSAHVVTAEFPKALLPGSQASEEIVAYLAMQKYQMGSPVYRIEQEFEYMGIRLSRMTMNNWINTTAQLLKPLMAYLHAQLLLEDVLLGDETTLRVLEFYKDGKPKKSYIWLVRTGKFAEHQIVMFRFETSRAQSHHIEFIEGFVGLFQSDGFEAYHGHDGIISVGCFSHAKGYFVDAAKDGTVKTEVNTAQTVVNIFDRMFYLDKQFRFMSPEERLKMRLKFVLPEMINLKNLLVKLEPITLKKSLLGKAITYCRNQWKYLMNVFLDGRLELSNNRSERSIKRYVMSRKNFLFAVTRDGGEASAIFLTLIETAKENGLDPQKYLTWVLKNIHTTEPSKLVPWMAPDSCKALQVNGTTSADNTESDTGAAWF